MFPGDDVTFSLCQSKMPTKAAVVFLIAKHRIDVFHGSIFQNKLAKTASA